MHYVFDTITELLEALNLPHWWTPAAREKLELDELLEKTYSLGVAHGRLQAFEEMALERDRPPPIELEVGAVHLRRLQATLRGDTHTLRRLQELIRQDVFITPKENI